MRSNGTVTYTGKDIAYTALEVGLLPIDFDYTPFTPRWSSGSVREEEIPKTCTQSVLATAHSGGFPYAPPFGHGWRVFNFIDVRQSTLEVVREGPGARVPREAGRSVHFSYEIVALSPKSAGSCGALSARNTGLSAEDENKPFVEMSGRRASGSRPTTSWKLLLERVARRNREPSKRRGGEADRRNARAIAIGALRYFLLRSAATRSSPSTSTRPQLRGGPDPTCSTLGGGPTTFRSSRRRGFLRSPRADLHPLPGTGGRLWQTPWMRLDPGRVRTRRRDPRARHAGAACLRPGAELHHVLPPPADPPGAGWAVRTGGWRSRVFSKGGWRVCSPFGIPEPGRI